jgi:hypothetical protein
VKKEQIMSFLKQAILFVLLCNFFSIPLLYANNLSTELSMLESEYKNLHSVVKDPKTVLLTEETMWRLGLKTQLVSLEGLVKAQAAFTERKGGRRGRYIAEDIYMILKISNVMKDSMEVEMIEIDSRIYEIREEIAQQKNEIFPPNSQQNNSSFTGFLEQLTSDEHLAALSFDNIPAQNNEGGNGTAMQNSEQFSPSPYDCGGILTKDYRGRLYSQFLKPKMDNWKNRRWSQSSLAVGSSLKTAIPKYQINLPKWEQRVNCIDSCTAQEIEYEADWVKCKEPCYTNTKFKTCKEY